MKSFQTGNGRPAGAASPIGGAARPYNMMGKEIGMEWKDQYKHPNWQRKRLEALESAEFACQRCESEEKQLHVHHRRYIKGRMIWEYEIEELEVLCDACHEDVHLFKDSLQSLIASIPSDHLPFVIGLVSGVFGKALNPEAFDPLTFFEADTAHRIGESARAINDHLSQNEVLALTSAVLTHKRQRSADTTLALTIGPKRGFF